MKLKQIEVAEQQMARAQALFDARDFQAAIDLATQVSFNGSREFVVVSIQAAQGDAYTCPNALASIEFIHLH